VAGYIVERHLLNPDGQELTVGLDKHSGAEKDLVRQAVLRHLLQAVELRKEGRLDAVARVSGR